MMTFRTVKTALTDLLGDNAAGRFRVIGYQEQAKATGELKNNDRLVQVYYSDGEFPKGSGRIRGEKRHDATYQIDLSASAPATGDLSVLESDTATAAQKASAIAAIREASEMADQRIDVLIDLVFNILMDARNEGLLLDNGVISSRWIPGIQKDTIVEKGDLVLKTANLKYTCTVQEPVSGATGNEPDDVIFDAETPIDESGESGTGVITEVDNT